MRQCQGGHWRYLIEDGRFKFVSSQASTSVVVEVPYFEVGLSVAFIAECVIA